MKKFCIIFLSFFIITVTVFSFSGCLSASGEGRGEYLRMHIRADSNDEEAQAVKYLVRDKLVEFLTPLVAEYETQAQAVAGVEENLDGIEEAANAVLAENGFAYTANAEVRVERFPTRVYDGYTLPAGEYTALIVELGEGKGDNWWCVVYPPLCFAATGGNVVYKSKIAEIVERWKAD